MKSQAELGQKKCLRVVKIDLSKIIFRKMVGTSEDWPYFYSGLISSSTSTNFPATVAAT